MITATAVSARESDIIIKINFYLNAGKKDSYAAFVAKTLCGILKFIHLRDKLKYL